MYEVLSKWKNPVKKEGKVANTTISELDEQIGKAALTELFKSHVYIRQCGKKYKNFRIDLQNYYMGGKIVYPLTVVDAQRRLEHCCPHVTSVMNGGCHAQIARKKVKDNNKGNNTQTATTGDKEKRV